MNTPRKALSEHEVNEILLNWRIYGYPIPKPSPPLGNPFAGVGRLISLVDLQFGSVGKGAGSEYLSSMASAVVRIGAANAGHTMFYNDKPIVMRTIPCGWKNEVADLVIGISSIISLDVLLYEIEMVHALIPIKHRLFIDPKAHVITHDQIQREMLTGLATEIASTSAKSGLGIGIAMADKILRSKNCRRAMDVPELQPYLCDTALKLNRMLDDGQQIILEGTQGFGLSIDHGFFPFTTSRDTTVQSLYSGVGLNPYKFDMDVIGVMRTYPIRVGGNSGPFDPDSQELTWKQVARRAGTTKDLTERTSVTGTVRRVATFSWQGFHRACMINRPTELMLTFADHLDYKVHEKYNLTPKVTNFIDAIETSSGIEVTIVKTGPKTLIDFDSYRSGMLNKVA